jgi:N-acetylneuraminic acid mutarotase
MRFLRIGSLSILVVAGCGGGSLGDIRDPGPRQLDAPRGTNVFSAAPAAVPMGTARAGLAAVLSGERILAIGGSDGPRLDVVEAYDPEARTWSALPPLSMPRAPVAAATANGRVYVFGGTGCSMPAASAFDPVAGSWMSAAAPSQGTLLAAALGPDGMVYALGGCGHGTTGPLGAVEGFDPSTGWRARAPMPTPRLSFAAVTASDGRLYAIGGWTIASGSGPMRGAITATVEAYDAVADTWTRVADLPTARGALAAVAAPDGRLYAIGGHATGPLATVEAYDPASNTWTPAPSLPTPRSDLAAVVSASGHIYAIGGTTAHATDTAGAALRTVEIYDPTSQTWLTP